MPDFFSANQIFSLLLHYRYAIFFPLAIIEGPIVTIIAGFLSSLGYLNLFIIFILALLGDFVGDIIYYLIGRWGGEKILKRGSFFGIKAQHLVKLDEHFQAHAGKTILLGKWTHYPGAPILVSAAMTKMPLAKYLWFSMLGTTPKVILLLVAGYYFGRAYQEIKTYFDYAALVLFFLAILIIVIYFIFKKIWKKSHV